MAITSELLETADTYDIDSVKRDAERMLADTERDPEGAITSACSMVESVCRFILNDLEVPLPSDKDVSHLVKETQKALNLSPERPDIEPDIKRILGALGNIAGGIGALRTKAGDAHGKDKGTPRLNGPILRFAIHSASTLSLFFIETWQARKGHHGKKSTQRQ